MDNNNNYDNTITTAPYNTMNLPQDKRPNLSNPQIKSNTQYIVPNNNPRQSRRIPLGTESERETNFYDPTKEMVNNYLKNDITMYDNRGKYFDSYLFNQKFEEYIKEKTTERKLKEQVQLYDLDSIDNIQVQPYQLPLDKLLINFKNIWFGLFDNLIEGKNTTNLFTTSNFFYFGITFVVIFILYIMLSYIFG
jgi:hypothetical protein